MPKVSFVDTLILKMDPERVQKLGSDPRSIHANVRHTYSRFDGCMHSLSPALRTMHLLH